jgi:hypothetical protein
LDAWRTVVSAQGAVPADLRGYQRVFEILLGGLVLQCLEEQRDLLLDFGNKLSHLFLAQHCGQEKENWQAVDPDLREEDIAIEILP